MHARPKDPRTIVTPAPGDYEAQNAEKVVQQAAPKYSFGTKPTITGTTHSPGMIDADSDEEVYYYNRKARRGSCAHVDEGKKLVVKNDLSLRRS